MEWFNTLDINKLVDPRNIQYIEIGKDSHRIEIIQTEKKFTVQEFQEIVTILDKIPIDIRKDLIAIKRVQKLPDKFPDAFAAALPEDGLILIPDTFYSVQINHNGMNNVHIQNKGNREDTFVHETFEVYVTGEIEKFVKEKMSFLNQFVPPNTLISVIGSIKKDLESSLLIRWIKAKGYELEEDVFRDFFHKDKYFSSWVRRIEEDGLISEQKKKEMIEMFRIAAMITSCWEYENVWKSNKYKVSQLSINPKEDLVEACREYFLNSSIYRQRVATAFKSDGDLTYLISYLILRNGPFGGLDYGLDKRGQDVAILYLGNSVTGERHYHIMGPMRYGERLFGNADFHVFLQQDLLPLVGDEANIALPETVKIGEKLLTIELRNKL